MKTLGEKIKILRKVNNLTQKELALKIGITASTITKYENGQLEPNIEVLNKIATTFNISVSTLIEHNNSKKELSFITDFKDVLGSGEIPIKAIDELTECVIIAIIKKYNLDIDIKTISDRDKRLMFSIASSSVKAFIDDLIDRKS